MQTSPNLVVNNSSLNSVNFDLNTEIAKKEFERMSLANNWKPFKETPEGFNDFIKNDTMSKIHLPLMLLSYIVSFVSLLGILSYFFDTYMIFTFVFFVDIIVAAILFYFINNALVNYFKPKNLLECLDVSKFNFDEKQILQAFDVFLNNNWKPHLWTQNHKDLILNDVNEALKKKDVESLKKKFNSILVTYYQDEYLQKTKITTLVENPEMK